MTSGKPKNTGRSPSIERDRRGRITRGVAQKTNKRDTAGRPLFNGREEKAIVQNLEWAFSIGATDLEACNHAGMSKSALYAYQKKHPEFLHRKEVLKQAPTLKARKAIFDKLDDPDFAMKYMERKKKDEFSPRQELSGPDSKPLADLTTEDRVDIARAYLKSKGVKKV